MRISSSFSINTFFPNGSVIFTRRNAFSTSVINTFPTDKNLLFQWGNICFLAAILTSLTTSVLFNYLLFCSPFFLLFNFCFFLFLLFLFFLLLLLLHLFFHFYLFSSTFSSLYLLFLQTSLFLFFFLILLLFKLFNPSITRWSFTGGWVTASLLKFSGHFWIFYLILTLLWPGWSQFFVWFPIPPVFFPSLWEPLQVVQLELVSPPPSCSTVFSAFWQDPSICLSFYILLFLVCGLLKWLNPWGGKFFLLINVA